MKGEHCGYLEFEYEVKTTEEVDGKNKTTRHINFLRLDLGTITKLTATLTKSKSGSGSSNIPGMGPRYNFYVDGGNTVTITIEFARRTPSRDARMPGHIPETDPLTHAFKLGDICNDQQQVVPNMTFAGFTTTDFDPESTYFSTERWSNAYWILALEKSTDRWQMKFDGADFVYFGEDPVLNELGRADDFGMEGMLPHDLKFHVYSSSLEYSTTLGTPELITGSLSLTVGRKLRSVMR